MSLARYFKSSVSFRRCLICIDWNIIVLVSFFYEPFSLHLIFLSRHISLCIISFQLILALIIFYLTFTFLFIRQSKSVPFHRYLLPHVWECQMIVKLTLLLMVCQDNLLILTPWRGVRVVQFCFSIFTKLRFVLYKAIRVKQPQKNKFTAK